MFVIIIFPGMNRSARAPFWPNRIAADGTKRGILSLPGAFLIYDAS